eukprot:TRINITY_DN12107_c1_g2_i1.p1 TRINITY_DN12107_c1_g2~~TRINITY_DN12107_c1_g2_i1.p1  ORF type:complete len:125 (+),score=11.58 TRINITY_DN12107_c1_g2_i1:1039-1413(+)
MDYTPPAVDDLFIILACCCEMCSLKEFACSAIEEFDLICLHGSSSCSAGEVKGCVKTTGACLCLDTRCKSGHLLATIEPDKFIRSSPSFFASISRMLHVGAIPCDDEVPFMIAICNAKLYDGRK